MDKNLLEFLGRALLNAAQSQKQLEDMNKIIGENFAVDNPFLKSFLKSIGWQSKEKMKAEDVVEITEKLSAAYMEFIKNYLMLFDIVPKDKHLSLIKENEELKAKVAQLEKIINSHKNTSDKDTYHPEVIMDNLTQIMSNQTQQFQELMKQLNQSYKRVANTKKKQ